MSFNHSNNFELSNKSDEDKVMVHEKIESIGQ